MKTRFIQYIALLFVFCHCQKDKVVQPDKPFAKKNAVAGIDTLVPTLVKDTNRIAEDPYRSGDYEFAESAEVFRQRFNAFMQKSGWKLQLKSGTASNRGAYNICTMNLTDSINIVVKLSKDNAVVKAVLFGTETISSELPVIKAMKGMVAAGPVHRSITDDDIEIIMYRLGTLADDSIFPRGIYNKDGVRYEVKVDIDKIYFGVEAR